MAYISKIKNKNKLFYTLILKVKLIFHYFLNQLYDPDLDIQIKYKYYILSE